VFDSECPLNKYVKVITNESTKPPRIPEARAYTRASWDAIIAASTRKVEEAMSLAENKGLWVGIALFAALIVIGAWVFLTAAPFTLVILFDQIGGLKKDSPVVWKQFTVGKVVDIQPLVDNQIGVTIRLRDEYVTKITRGSEFYLKPGPMLGFLGDDSIEVVTTFTSGSPFAKGEKIQGKRRPDSSLLEVGVKWTQEYLKQLKDQTSQLLDDFSRSPYRRQVEEALRELKEIADQGATLAKDKLEEYQKKHSNDLERIRKKLEKLRDEMRKRGDSGGAKRLEEQIEKMESK